MRQKSLRLAAGTPPLLEHDRSKMLTRYEELALSTAPLLSQPSS